MTKRPPSVFTKEAISKALELLSLGESEYSCIVNNLKLSWSGWSLYKAKKAAAAIGGDLEAKQWMDNYTRARENGFEQWEHEIMRISKDQSRDQLETETSYIKKDGSVTTKKERRSDNTAVNRDALITRNMQWILARRASRVYGDRTQSEVTHKGSPISQLIDRPTTETSEQWQERVEKERLLKTETDKTLN